MACKGLNQGEGVVTGLMTFLEGQKETVGQGFDQVPEFLTPNPVRVPHPLDCGSY